MSRAAGGIISWKSTDSDGAVIDNLSNQVLDNDRRRCSKFRGHNLHGQHRISLALGGWGLDNGFFVLSHGMFNLFGQVIVLGIGFILPVPFFTLSSMQFIAAVRTTSFLPAYLSYIRQEPFSANGAGALSS
jgi:hypothetical protein